MARAGNALDTIGGFLATLDGYLSYVVAILFLASGAYLVYLRTRGAEREPGEPSPLAFAAAAFGLALLVVLSARLQFAIAKNNSYRTLRQAKGITALLPFL